MARDRRTAPARREVFVKSRKESLRAAVWPTLAVLFVATPATFAGPAAAQGQPAGPQSAEPGSSALRQAVSDPRVERFYEARDWRPAWNSDQAQALLQALDEAPRHGLDAAAFMKPPSVETPDRRDAALTLAALSYAEALGSGLVDPNSIQDIYTLERNKVDPVAGLEQALQSGDVGRWLASLAPQDAEYRALSQSYLEYRQRSRDSQREQIGGGPLIRQGESDPRVPKIARALRAEGYLEQRDTQAQGQAGTQANGQGEAAQAGANLYTEPMAEAVRKLQADFGIAVDGIVGPNTLEALNAGPTHRARQLAVNLERRRWLTRNPPANRVDVNTAAAEMDYFHDGAKSWKSRVVVGRHDWPTPSIGSPIFQLVANPPWYVPQSIAQEEILPKGRDYMRRNDMYMKDGRIIQRPGPEAALGLVKFDMHNRYAIFLHDTPAKSLFERSMRHRSHGCVRVEDAVEFARHLAERHGIAAEFNQALDSGDTQAVSLPSEVPVRMLYHTAFVDDGGQVTFRADTYDWDAKLSEALGLGAGRRTAKAPVTIPLGP